MPEGFPAHPSLPEASVQNLDEYCERVLGPVVGAFTPEEVTNGGHPDEVRAAWTGVRLPVRRDANQEMQYGPPRHICISTGEAFNALAASDTAQDVLDYWMNILPNNADELFVFLAEDGQYERLNPEQEQSSEVTD